MFCPKCGKENLDDAVFCGGCGARLSKPAAAAPDPAPAPAPKKAPSLVGKQSKTLIIAAVIAVVVVIAGGFGIYKAFFEPYPITPETFPDKTFAQYVRSNFDTNGDDKLSRDEARAVTEIGNYNEAAQIYTNDLSGEGIASLKGIEYFSELKTLVAANNPLTSVDLSKNGKLEQVNIASDTLVEVDVSGCNSLTALWVGSGTQVKGASSSLHENLLMAGYSNPGSYSYEYTYALDGKLTDAKYTGSSDSYTSSNHYTFDANGNCVGENYKSDSYSNSYKYEYNENNQLVKTTNESGSYTYIDTFAYDEDGNLSARTYTSMKGSSVNYSTSWAYTFEKGNLVSGSYKNDSGNTSKADFTYDDNGKCTGYTYSYSGSDGATTVVYTYDEQGRLTSSTSKYTTGDPYTTTYTYNEAGDEQTQTNSSGSYKYSVIKKFDEEGRLIEGASYSNGEMNTKKDFTYAKGLIPNGYTYEYYYKGKLDNTYSYSAKFLKLYSTTDYESRTTGYKFTQPYEHYGNSGDSIDSDIENYFNEYAKAYNGILNPRVCRISILGY